MTPEQIEIPEAFKKWVQETAKEFADGMMFEPLEKMTHHADKMMHEAMMKAGKYMAEKTLTHLSAPPAPQTYPPWFKVEYKPEFSNPIMTDICPRPKDKKHVLVKVEGQKVYYVAWCKTWSDGAFWIIPGGTPESHNGKSFIVTHWCDCLPTYSEDPAPQVEEKGIPWLKDLIAMAEDGDRLNRYNGVHQEFLAENQDVLRAAKAFLQSRTPSPLPTDKK